MQVKITLTLLLFCIANILVAQTPFERAFNHLQNSNQYEAGDLADVAISDTYESRHNGLTHVYLQQRYKGIAVKYAITNFNIKEDKVSSANGAFIVGLQQKVNTIQAQISPSEALQKVLSEHNLSGSIPLMISASDKADRKTTFEKGTIALEDIEVKLIFLKQQESLRLCWEVSLYEKSADHWWVSTIDAINNELLEEHDQVIHCSFHSNSNHSVNEKVKHLAEITIKRNAALVADSYNVFAFPVESPNHGSRTLEISPWNAAGDAGTLGWHDDGTTTYTHTKGNNADAYEDQNDSNNPTGGNDARADGGNNLEFDFPLDLSTNPESDPDPYITNLFYWNNIMHDVWYQYGFDEPSGNFQEDNLGRGGSGGDFVRAEAQDGGGTNNANFATPTDGGNPRMQMFLWSANDSDFLEVNAPAGVAGSYEMAAAAFGGDLDVGTTGDVAEVDDGSDDPTLACNDLVNGTEISGKVALIDRGTCEFGSKSLRAQNEGAIAVIMCNYEDELLTMGPGDDGAQVTIPVVMLTESDCITIRNEIGNGLNVTMEIINNPPIDGDLDNGIIAHEYGHGISIRLTGGPSANNCLNNEEQMGEGWSDFFGIWMTIEANDNHDDSRGVGTYAIGQATTGGGIRPAPYTTDMSVNDYTYGNVDDNNISQPHGIGFIWCTMIWDLTWAMINEHGLDMDLYNGGGGNNITAQLILDGLKGQPCSPGFVDGRDAILQADEDNNDSANRNIIWNVFARRGLGFSADQGSSSNRNDQTEAFDLPPDVPFMTEEELFEIAPLPVELLSFYAIANNQKNSIDLLWSTASEINNKGFDIQRKTDNTNFETIAWQDAQAANNLVSNYSLNDNEVRSGIEYYYRLRQVDLDGKESFSEIVNAKLNKPSEEIQVFPNPTNGLSTIQFPESIVGKVDFKILNGQGQIVGVQVFESNGAAELEIDLSNQPEGVYFLQFNIGETQIVKRVVVRK